MTTTIRPPLDTGVAAHGPRLLLGRADLTSHLSTYGPPPVEPGGLIRLAHDAGLRGRGGAGFPTARKLSAVASQSGPRVAVANGTEGEPLSAKDKTMLVRSPHLVLDGLEAAASAVGATRRIICVERGNPIVEHAVTTALAERSDRTTELVATPRRYVAGQETALVDWIEGGAGRPNLRRPFEHGVAGRPTLVDNVETLAHLALIARFGAAWYRSAGTGADPGTTLVTVTGAVERPGVREVASGASLRSLLSAAGSSAPRGVLVGGYFGRWISADVAAGLLLGRASADAPGAGLGCGVIAVVDRGSCAVAELARVAEWFAAASAGQCGACTWGLRDLAAATGAVHAGTSDPAAPADIRRWTAMVRGRGACKLPDGAATFLETGLEVFAEEIVEHQEGRCRREDHHLLPAPDQEPWQ